MTNRLANTTVQGELLVFPDFPPRDDMQNFLYIYREAYSCALERYLGKNPTTLVMCETPVDWRPSRHPRIPDLMVAFGVNTDEAIGRRGYSINEHGKPPDFVLEVASPTTARNDYTRKRVDYAAFGIPEYWRFDSSGGRWYDRPLAGDRLVEGSYQPIEVQAGEDNRLWGRSQVLGLDLCWEEGRLRWWDPVAGAYLSTYEEEADGRLAAEARVVAEQESRMAAEARVAAEQESRMAAEARIRELEAELERRSDP